MNTFVCDSCGKTYPKAWSDADASKEMVEAFTPKELSAGTATVCEPCWLVMRKNDSELDSRYKQ